jgi:hypothetical protein
VLISFIPDFFANILKPFYGSGAFKAIVSIYTYTNQENVFYFYLLVYFSYILSASNISIANRILIGLRKHEEKS